MTTDDATDQSVQIGEPRDHPTSRNTSKRAWGDPINAPDEDNVESLLRLVPVAFSSLLQEHELYDQLMEISMDVGRTPKAYFRSSSIVEEGDFIVQDADIQHADDLLNLSRNNRVVIDGTLHRIGKIVNSSGRVIGMTLRVGRAARGHVELLEDVVSSGKSVLLLGKPGVGKTTMIRGMARSLAEQGMRVVIVDSCNEIAGNSDVPHHSIGRARRVQIPCDKTQSQVMIEVVENHTPDVMIIDELSTSTEVANCKTIAERGIQLIATAHGTTFMNIIRNPVLNKLAGGISTVILSGRELEQQDKDQRTVRERAGSPTFPIVVELRDPKTCIVHWTKHSMDLLLRGETLNVQVRQKFDTFRTIKKRNYSDVLSEFELSTSDQASLIKDLSTMNSEHLDKKRRQSPKKSPRKSPRKRRKRNTSQPSEGELMDHLRSAPGREYLSTNAPYGCSKCSVYVSSLYYLYTHASGKRHLSNCTKFIVRNDP